MIRIVTLLFCVAGALATVAQEPNQSLSGDQLIVAGPATLTVKTNRPSVLVAEPIELQLIVDAPAAAVVTLPPIGKRLGSLDVVDIQSWNALPVEGGGADRRRWINVLTVESLLSGDFQIPSIDVACRTGDDDYILKSEPINIQVKTALGDGEQASEIREIKNVVDVDVPRSRTWAITSVILGIGVICVVALGAYRLHRRGRAITPIQLAQQRLERLKTDGREWEQADSCAELSRIVRNYLEQRTGVAATTRSSEELHDEIGALDRLDESLRGRLDGLLLDLDQTRYGGAPMGQAPMGQAPVIERAGALIEDIERATAPWGTA